MPEAGAVVVQLQGLRDKHPALERSSWSDIHIAAAVAEGLLAVDSGRTSDGLRLLTWAYEDLLSTNNLYGAPRGVLTTSVSRLMPLSVALADPKKKRRQGC